MHFWAVPPPHVVHEPPEPVELQQSQHLMWLFQLLFAQQFSCQQLSVPLHDEQHVLPPHGRFLLLFAQLPLLQVDGSQRPEGPQGPGGGSPMGSQLE